MLVGNTIAGTAHLIMLAWCTISTEVDGAANVGVGGVEENAAGKVVYIKLKLFPYRVDSPILTFEY